MRRWDSSLVSLAFEKEVNILIASHQYNHLVLYYSVRQLFLQLCSINKLPNTQWLRQTAFILKLIGQHTVWSSCGIGWTQSNSASGHRWRAWHQTGGSRSDHHSSWTRETLIFSSQGKWQKTWETLWPTYTHLKSVYRSCMFILNRPKHVPRPSPKVA